MASGLALRLIEIRKESQARLAQIEAAYARELADRISASLDRVVRAIETSRPKAFEDFIASLEAIMADTTAETVEVWGALVEAVYAESISAAAESLMLIGVPADTIAAVALVFDTTYRPDLISSAHREWLENLSPRALEPHSALRRAVMDIQLEGKSIERAAQLLAERDPSMSMFPAIEREVSALARATRIARTESTRVDNVSSIAFAESVGLNDFVNIGVGDDRQTRQCRVASKQKPHPLHWWRSAVVEGESMGPPPPRHVNCRCVLRAVPPRDYQVSVNDLERLGIVSGGG